MKLHLGSFAFGIASGFAVLLLVGGVLHVVHPSGSTATTQNATGGASSRGGNSARLAQRLGITQAELQQELSDGKTIQQVAAEHGVTLGGGGGGGFGGGQRSGSGATSGSGTTASGSLHLRTNTSSSSSSL